ncbi:MAG: hypothetical protein J6J18_06530 [Oscillospiraceae bacterium]|nr:hypothetical protein [Oscillospiraceae bacterium]
MSLFVGKVKVKNGEAPWSDLLYARFWTELGKPLLHQPQSDKATAAEEAAAKELLKKTLLRCRKLMGETRRYPLVDFTHDVGYLGEFLRLKQQLVEKRWCDACYTLAKMIKYYCANEVRTMYTIIGVLEEYL